MAAHGKYDFIYAVDAFAISAFWRLLSLLFISLPDLENSSSQRIEHLGVDAKTIC